MACASYWRGAWYFLDDHLFPESTMNSAVSSLGLGTVGMVVCQGVAGVSLSSPWNRWIYSPTSRFGALYVLSTSCVLVWRGAWLLCDVAYEEAVRYYYSLSIDHSRSTCQAMDGTKRIEEINRPTHRRLTREENAPTSFTHTIRATDPHHRTLSGIMSHGLAMVGLLCAGRFASVLAPPARASIARDAALYSKSLIEYRKMADWLFRTTK